MGVVERAGIAVIARFANPRVELNVLAIAQRGERGIFLGIECDLGARMRFEFENEALAFSRNSRRLHHAAGEDHDFAAFGIELWRRTGSMHQRDEGTCEEQAGAAARARYDTGLTPQREDAKSQQRGNRGQKFGLVERYEAGNQDPRGDGSQGPQQGSFTCLRL